MPTLVNPYVLTILKSEKKMSDSVSSTCKLPVEGRCHPSSLAQILRHFPSWGCLRNWFHLRIGKRMDCGPTLRLISKENCAYSIQHFRNALTSDLSNYAPQPWGRSSVIWGNELGKGMSIGDIEVSNNTLKTAVGNLEINAWFQKTFLHHPASNCFAFGATAKFHNLLRLHTDTRVEVLEPAPATSETSAENSSYETHPANIMASFIPTLID